MENITGKPHGNGNSSSELDELWQLYAQEGRDNLDLIEDALLCLEKDPSNREQIAILFRSVHSFKGGARMMGLSVLEGLAHHAEDLAALVRDVGVVMDEEIIEILLKTTDLMRQQLAVVLEKHSDSSPESTAEMVRQLEELVDRKKGSIPDLPPEVESELSMPQSTQEETGSPLEEDGQSDFIPTSVLPTDVSKVTPSMDNQYVRIFIEMADAEIERLKAAMQELRASRSQAQGGKQGAEHSDTYQSILAACLTLERAARHMGYDGLLSTLERLQGVLHQAVTHGKALSKGEMKQLNDGHKKLISDLEALRPLKKEETPPAQPVAPVEVPQPVRLVLDEEQAAEMPPMDAQAVIGEQATVPGAVSLESLNEMLERSGEVIADYSVLKNLIERMARKNPTMGVRRAFVNGDEQSIAEMNEMLVEWEKDFQSLKQVSTNMDGALNDMREKARILGAHTDTVIDAMNVRIGDVFYAIPVNSIRRIITLNDQNLVRSSAEGRNYFIKLEGALIPLRLLAQKNGELPLLAVVLEGEGQKACALGIEELLGQQQVLIHPLRGLLSDSRNASGCALLEDGKVGMMLNLNALLYPNEQEVL